MPDRPPPSAFPEGGPSAELRDLLRRVAAGQVTPELATEGIARWFVLAVDAIARKEGLAATTAEREAIVAWIERLDPDGVKPHAVAALIREERHHAR